MIFKEVPPGETSKGMSGTGEGRGKGQTRGRLSEKLQLGPTGGSGASVTPQSLSHAEVFILHTGYGLIGRGDLSGSPLMRPQASDGVMPQSTQGAG